MKEMTSRERLLACLKREPTDRVPISCYELCAYDSDAWYNHEASYAKLMDAIKEKSDCILMCAPDYEYTSPVVHRNSYRQGEYIVTDTVWETNSGSFKMQTKRKEDVVTTWTTEHFLKDEEDIERFLNVDLELPKVNMDRFYRLQKEMGDKGIMMLDFGDPLEAAAFLLGMDKLLVYIYTERELIDRLMDKLFVVLFEMVKGTAEYDIHDCMARIYGPEYCTPPYLPESLFPELCSKYLKPMIKVLRDAGAFVRIHSHGNIRGNLDEFVRCGAQATDPIEPLPDGNISLADVKKGWGDKLVLFGNIELKDLEFDEPQQIRELVRRAMVDAKEGGGFVLLPTATPINIPLNPKTCENFITMMDAALEFGRYQ